MNTYDAPSLIRDTISSYAARTDSVHEQISKIDFITRLALALSSPSALTRTSLQMQPNPGLGVLHEMLNVVKMHSHSSPLIAVVDAGLKLLATSLPYQDLPSIYRLRNHLFHGGSLPESSVSAGIAATLDAAIEECSKEVRSALTGASITSDKSVKGDMYRATLHVGGDTYDLFPLLLVSPASNVILVFSRVTSSSISFSGPKHDSRHTLPRRPVDDLLRRLFKLQQPADTFMADYMDAALEDLKGFQEDGSPVTYVSEGNGAYIRWEHATSSSTEVRQDHLRVGPDNAWQWHDGSKWTGYSNFLRHLVNWSLLTKRLTKLLDERMSRTKVEESSMLPLPASIHPPFIPPAVSVGEVGQERTELALDSFMARLDTDVQANRGNTYLYFMHAEAGAGKTTALLTSAIRRAKICAAGEESLPILFYVSAHGKMLENLAEAVDAASAKTFILSSARVQALCRNGLMILIVDGFDELVGAPTYGDALVSLRPWLESMGGRGVMVVSARSNYFVHLYQDSIRKSSNSDINVTHFIAELSRWTPEQRDQYFAECGVQDGQLQRVPRAELEMLRLPFFARASISHLLSGTHDPDRGMVRELMRDYVEREQSKLQRENEDPIVTAADLENFFEELAAYMMESNAREVPMEDVLLNAEVSMSDINPEVKNRLASLCGLDVNEGRRFRFMHEIVLDFFFGQYVGRKLNAENAVELRRILSGSQLTAGAARVAIRVWTPKPHLLLSLIRPEAEGSGAAPLASNLGMLWREVFSAGQTISGFVISGVLFPPIEISGSQIKSVTFNKCEFTSLVIRDVETPNIKFVDCGFDDVLVDGSGKGLTFHHCSIDVVTTTNPRTYADSPDEISQALRSVGSQVEIRRYSVAGAGGGTAEQAGIFLDKINRRADLSIVVNAKNLPVDASRFGWITRNSEDWLTFLEVLEKNELASLEHLSAGGPPKWRIRWAVQPADILNRNSQDNDTMRHIRDFWNSLAEI